MTVKSNFKEYYSSFYGNQYLRELIYVDTDLDKNTSLRRRFNYIGGYI